MSEQERKAIAHQATEELGVALEEAARMQAAHKFRAFRDSTRDAVAELYAWAYGSNAQMTSEDRRIAIDGAMPGMSGQERAEEHIARLRAGTLARHLAARAVVQETPKA